MNFRDKLNNIESTFDPNAWDQMEELLDSNEKTNSYFIQKKWWLLLLGILIALSLFTLINYFSWSKDNGLSDESFSTEQELSNISYQEQGINIMTAEIDKSDSKQDHKDKSIVAGLDSSSPSTNTLKASTLDYQKEKAKVFSGIENDDYNVDSKSDIERNDTYQNYQLHLASSDNSANFASLENESQERKEIILEHWKEDFLQSLSLKGFGDRNDIDLYKNSSIEAKEERINPYRFHSVFVGGGISRDDAFYNGYNLELGYSRSFNKFLQFSAGIGFHNLNDRRFYAIKNDVRDFEYVGKFQAQIGLTPITYRRFGFRIYAGGYFSYGVYSLRNDGILVPVENIVAYQGVGSTYYWHVGSSLYYRMNSHLHFEFNIQSDVTTHYNLRIHKTIKR